MEAGESVTGCTVHYVNDELDGGEIIIQREVPIDSEDTIETLTRKIQLQEYGILPVALETIKERLGIKFLLLKYLNFNTFKLNNYRIREDIMLFTSILWTL